jgi:pyruvate/2-oxoglutarate dehydrogenase complex dihydrolipoamide acyltransferase (E2) component
LKPTVARFELKLPDLGEDAGDVATVSFWYAEPGENVKVSEGIVEMMTDKATFDVPCPVSGKLIEIRARDGAKVKVGKVLGIIETS